MKNQRPSPSIIEPAVQVAVWREAGFVPEANADPFFDFARPLRLLDSAGWGGQIKANSDGQGFFVFSVSSAPTFE